LGDQSNSLNGSQRQRLLITCKHIDQLLRDIEATLNAATSKGVFPSYINDIGPEQREEIEEQVAKLRQKLLEVLDSQSLSPGEPQISAAHSIDVGLTFIEVAIEELAPRYMRGYGPVSEPGTAELHGIMTKLQSVSKGFHRYVRELAEHAQQH